MGYAEWQDCIGRTRQCTVSARRAPYPGVPSCFLISSSGSRQSESQGERIASLKVGGWIMWAGDDMQGFRGTVQKSWPATAPHKALTEFLGAASSICHSPLAYIHYYLLIICFTGRWQGASTTAEDLSSLQKSRAGSSLRQAWAPMFCTCSAQ